MSDRPTRILHGFVDAGLLRLDDARIQAVRFSRDQMPIDCHHAVLLVLPDGGTDNDAIAAMALENERLKKLVEQLERDCMQMAQDLLLDADAGFVDAHESDTHE